MSREWPPIVPLDELNVPAFPVKALPFAIRAYAEGLAESHQVPVDLPAMLMLITVSAAISKKIKIQLSPD